MNLTQLIQATAPKLHAKYSPNLHKWLKKHSLRQQKPTVYRDAETQRLSIGWIYPGDCFVGTELNRVLCQGSRSQTWSYSRRLTNNLQPITALWEQYVAIGRCAVDPRHAMHFIGDETRWAVKGDTRSCTWCGIATQRMRRWTETVERKAWVTEHPEGTPRFPAADRCGDNLCSFVDLKPPGTGSRCTTCGFECPF
jgi:hypothetical protein